MPAQIAASLVGVLLDAALKSIAAAAAIRAAAQQSGEWTTAQEAEFKAKKEAAYASSAWQIAP